MKSQVSRKELKPLYYKNKSGISSKQDTPTLAKVDVMPLVRLLHKIAKVEQ